MTSRVVPASSDTMAASRRASALRRLDLPALGAPSKATRNPSRRISPRWPSLRWRAISSASLLARDRAASNDDAETSPSSEKSMAASVRAAISIRRVRQPS